MKTKILVLVAILFSINQASAKTETWYTHCHPYDEVGAEAKGLGRSAANIYNTVWPTTTGERRVKLEIFYNDPSKQSLEINMADHVDANKSASVIKTPFEKPKNKFSAVIDNYSELYAWEFTYDGITFGCPLSGKVIQERE